MTQSSGDVDGVVRLAEGYLATRNYLRAEEVLRSGLAAEPHHPRLLTAYARARLGQGDAMAAANSAHAALAIEPEYEYPMRIYALALQEQGRWQEALWMAWRTVTTHPRSQSAHFTYAHLLEATGRYPEALPAVDEALRLDPADVDSLVLRGDILVHLGQLDAAEAAYGEALRLRPDDGGAVHSLARLQYLRRRRWGAIRGFIGAGSLDPRLGDVSRRNVGVVLTEVLRRCTWLVLIVVFAVMVTTAQHEDGDPTVLARIVAGVGAALLLVTYTRVMHRLPRPVLKSVVRERKLLAVRIAQHFAAVVLGAQTAVFGAMTLPSVLSAFLLLSLPIVGILGRLRGERLW